MELYGQHKRRENEVFISLRSVVEEAGGCFPPFCICLDCRKNENVCSEIWMTPGEDGLELFQRPPVHSLLHPQPCYREILCVHDWVMSKQKPYSKNKTFTNSELSKQNKFSKNMNIINCCFSYPLAVVIASKVRLCPSTYSSCHFYHPSVSCRDPAPGISWLNLFIKVSFLRKFSAYVG